jgi:hypothetical protein
VYDWWKYTEWLVIETEGEADTNVTHHQGFFFLEKGVPELRRGERRNIRKAL